MLKKCTKYILFGGITFIILKMVPSKRFNERDIIFITLIVMIATFSLDCLTQKDKENFKQNLDLDVDANLHLENFSDHEEEQELSENVRILKERYKKMVETRNKQDDQFLGKDTDKKEVADKTEKIDCTFEVFKIRKELQDTIKELRKEISEKESTSDSAIAEKYIKSLIQDLRSKGIIDKIDVQNIFAKIESDTVTMRDTISKLEKLKEIGVPKDQNKNNDLRYNTLSTEFNNTMSENISNKWSENDEYALLSTKLWSIPQKPIEKCVISPQDKSDVLPVGTNGYPTNLKDWDNSRKVSNVKISQSWSKNQEDSPPIA